MPETFDTPSISAEAAEAMLRRAQERAHELGVPSVIAVVDPSGVLKAYLRMDRAVLGSVQVAQDKAYSAAATAMPTDAWYGVSQGDPAFGFGLSGIERLCPLGGGLPVMVDGTLVGGIGVSGGTVEQDTDVANAATAGATV